MRTEALAAVRNLAIPPPPGAAFGVATDGVGGGRREVVNEVDWDGGWFVSVLEERKGKLGLRCG